MPQEDQKQVCKPELRRSCLNQISSLSPNREVFHWANVKSWALRRWGAPRRVGHTWSEQQRECKRRRMAWFRLEAEGASSGWYSPVLFGRWSSWFDVLLVSIHAAVRPEVKTPFQLKLVDVGSIDRRGLLLLEPSFCNYLPFSSFDYA